MTVSQQQSVTIDYFPTHIVEKLVRFMYDGKVTVDHEHLEEVIIAADYLQVSKHEHMEEVIIAADYLQVSKHEHMEEVIIAAHYLQVSKHEHMEKSLLLQTVYR